MCVEAHKEHAPMPVGLEDAEYELVDGDDDEEEHPSAGSAEGFPPGVEEASGLPQPLHEEGETSSVHARTQEAVYTDDEYMAALGVCVQRAAASCDASFLKQLLKRRWQSSSKRKADCSPAGEALRKQIAAEHVAEVARRKQESEDLQKLKIAATLSEAKLAEARAKEHQSRREALEQAVRAKDLAAEERRLQSAHRSRIRWLATEYPCILARRLMADRRAWSLEKIQVVGSAVRRLEKKGMFERELAVPQLWAEEGACLKDLVRDIGSIACASGKAATAKCGLQFQWSSYVDLERMTLRLGPTVVME